ncbi:MAG: helix-turn-helix transcriptional regulator [Myxococcales bacterium]|nr:helix-turn-helix transcriptional regulator [Myxococcales bacterium]
MQYMREHLSEDLTVSDLARVVFMSPSHFAHRFRAVARTSPKRFLKTLRLEKARDLLVIEGISATQTGLHVGYRSVSHFSRDFKDRFGLPPGSYADAIRSRGSLVASPPVPTPSIAGTGNRFAGSASRQAGLRALTSPE